MKKSSIQTLPEYFDRYIEMVKEDHLLDAFESSLKVLDELNWERYNAIGHKVYEKGKWTLHEIFQHILDNERVQTYRALRMVRGDYKARARYDHELFAHHSDATSRPLKEIVEELILVRQATKYFYSSIPSNKWHSTADCDGIQLSPLMLGFHLVGHQIYHLEIIKERYWDL